MARREPQQVTIEIPDANITQRVTTDPSGYAEFKFAAKLQLWSPKNPKLYRVVLSAAGDRVEDQIGFRTIETRGTKILLNGKPIFLRGISMHEEAAFRGGRAFSAEDDAVLLGWARELGCNFVRLAHYPYNEDMIRLADQMGLLVWEEIPVYWEIDWKNPATLQIAEEQMRDLIARDHNRAAAIFWSIGNETPVSPARLEFMKQLASYAREQDSTRLITAALNHIEQAGDNTRLLNDSLGEFLDVVGLNEYVGWYNGSIASTDTMQWKFAYDKPLIVSEFGAEAPLRRAREPRCPLDGGIPNGPISAPNRDVAQNSVACRDVALGADGFPFAAPPAHRRAGFLQSQGPDFRPRPAQASVLHAAEVLQGDGSRSAGPISAAQRFCASAVSKSAAALSMPPATLSMICATCGICASASFHFFSSMYSRTAATVFAPYPV